MNDPLVLLAQQANDPAEEFAGSTAIVRRFFDHLDILHHPDELLDGLAAMPLVLASVIVIVGALCILNGYRWHKWVVVVLAFLGGLALGKYLSDQMGRSHVIAIAIGLLCAIVATPLLRVAVALFGGLTGAFIGANAWTALQASPPDAQWAGAAMGFILLAMASLILFRLVIVLFTSVGGASMVIFGGITLLLQVPAWGPSIRTSLASNQLLIPLLVTVAAVGGFVLQESRLRQSAPAEG
jgi:hypothetical protein